MHEPDEKRRTDRRHLLYLTVAAVLMTSVVGLIGIDRWRALEEARACHECCQADWADQDLCRDVCGLEGES